MLALYLAYLDEAEDKILFEDIFYSYRKQMYTMAESILHNSSDSEDAVSAVFLRIAQKNWDVVRSIQSKTDLRNYLLKATKNTSLNMIKIKKRDEISLNVVTEYNTKYDKYLSDDTFVEFISNNIEYDEVIEAMKSLNDIYRDALYYHFVMEMTIPETAKSLNCTVSTTKKQLVRGKKMLLCLLNIRGDEKNGNEQI